MKGPSSIYDFADYKAFLLWKAGPTGSRKGIRGAMAKTLRCQPTYVSQVLNSGAHFSLEQAEALASFFGLTSEETHFFLLLLQRDRAGTQTLKKYFSQQIEKVLTDRLNVKARVGTQSVLTPENQSMYYSSWCYAAVHIALSIPTLRTKESLASALGISLSRVAEVLDFLTKAGLVELSGSEYITTNLQVFLGKESHNILKHHTNWRNKAMQSLDRETLRDLHYSAVYSLSEKDVLKIKDKILEFISETVQTVKESKEESLYCWCVDFFDLTLL